MGFFAVKTRKKGECVEHIPNNLDTNALDELTAMRDQSDDDASVYVSNPHCL